MNGEIGNRIGLTWVSILLFLISLLFANLVVSPLGAFSPTQHHQCLPFPVYVYQVVDVNQLGTADLVVLYLAFHSMSLRIMWIDNTENATQTGLVRMIPNKSNCYWKLPLMYLGDAVLLPRWSQNVECRLSKSNHTLEDLHQTALVFLPAKLRQNHAHINQSLGNCLHDINLLTSCMDRLLNELIFKLFNFDSTLRGVCAGDSFGLLLRSLRRNLWEFSFKYSSYDS